MQAQGFSCVLQQSVVAPKVGVITSTITEV